MFYFLKTVINNNWLRSHSLASETGDFGSNPRSCSLHSTTTRYHCSILSRKLGKAAGMTRRFISSRASAFYMYHELDKNLVVLFDFDVVSRYGFAVRAYDANGNVATPSNFATLVFPLQRSMEPTSASEPTTVESLPAAILAVIIIIAVAVVAASSGVFLYLYRKQHRGDASKA